NGSHFDDVRPGYQGTLYLEVMSRTFTVFVRAGLALNQLRLSSGPVAPLGDKALQALHKQAPMLLVGRKRVGQLPVSNDGLLLSLDSAEGLGSRAALEVRAHDVPFKVEHGQRVAKLVYYKMSAEPEALYGANGSNYQFQAETLSKHFARAGGREVVAPAEPAVGGERRDAAMF